MSSIFVPEQASFETKAKFPAIFAKAITRFNQIKPSEKLVADLVNNLQEPNGKKLELSLTEAEEKIWALWGGLQVRNKAKS
jgi:hypothetical protein